MKKDTNIIRNFIWNTLGTGMNSVNSLLFTIVVTRVNGLNDSGIFILAFATALIFFNVGSYAGRVFQVTETNDFNDKEFISHRLITCAIMILGVITFIVLRQYDIYKGTIFILVTIYKCIEAFSEVLYGILQRNNMLHKIGKSLLVKSVLGIILFAIIDIFTGDLILACLGIVFVNVIITIVYDIPTTKRYVKTSENVRWNKVFIIFKTGFFAFAIAILGLYIFNAPKYSIDQYLNNEIQAVFGIIIMPASVMALFGQFILHPYLTTIVQLHKDNNKVELNKLINKLAIQILAIGVIISILAFTLGTKVLGLIYGVDLNNYSLHLLFIMLVATLYTIAIVYSSILTTIRKMFIQFVMYLGLAVFAYLSANILTMFSGINGATISYCLIILIQFILYFVGTKILLNKKNNDYKENLI